MERVPVMESGMQLLNRDGHSISHNSKRHYHDAFVSMNRMRQRGLLCDIVLHVANKEIKGHKLVLASCSPYFHAMFTNEMSESRQTHVTLHDIDPQALEQLIQYAYTAEIVVGEGNVQTLLPAASLLQLNGVRDACCKFLLSQLDPSNSLGIRGFADTHSCSELLKSAHKYVLQHFVEVSKTEEFMLLPLKQVLDLISSDNLNVPSEEEVYRAVLSWVKHDVDSRRQHVPRVVAACLPSMETAKPMTRGRTDGTWWPPCPRGERGLAWQRLGTDSTQWGGTMGLPTCPPSSPTIRSPIPGSRRSPWERDGAALAWRYCTACSMQWVDMMVHHV